MDHPADKQHGLKIRWARPQEFSGGSGGGGVSRWCDVPNDVVAVPGAAGLALAPALVVAWAQCGPTGQAFGRAKAGHVVTDLDEDQRCGHLVDAGDGLQQFVGPGIGVAWRASGRRRYRPMALVGGASQLGGGPVRHRGRSFTRFATSSRLRATSHGAPAHGFSCSGASGPTHDWLGHKEDHARD